MPTPTDITNGIAREKLEVAKELVHFSVGRTTKSHATGGSLVSLTEDASDANGALKKTALDNAIRLIEAKGIAVPAAMNFFFSSHERVRCVAYMSDAAVPDVFIGPKICQLNPKAPHVGTITIEGGLGKVGTRGVSSQIYDSTGSIFSSSATKMKAQATTVIVHELGHVLHSQLDPNSFWDGKVSVYADTKWKTESEHVSHYATQNGLEFVAETFCGTIMGRKYGAGVQTAYAALGGPTSTKFWN